MRQLCSKSISKRVGWAAALVLSTVVIGKVCAAPTVTERDPVTLSVVTVNPSAERTQTVPVKVDLPPEVTPADVLESGGLKLEYDEARKAYYLSKDDVDLAPKETKVFKVLVRDVWYIPTKELSVLKDYGDLLMSRLATSAYAATAKQMNASIQERLQQIQTTQDDESLSRKSRIGAYRYHLQDIVKIKDDLARMEKLLTFVGGPPVPEMLENSPLKSDAPSRTTTWLVIFLIVIFTGLLGSQFFFTWHRRTQVTQELSVVRQQAFEKASNGRGSAPPASPPPAAPRPPA